MQSVQNTASQQQTSKTYSLQVRNVDTKRRNSRITIRKSLNVSHDL